jgi:hypothetical protein
MRANAKNSEEDSDNEDAEKDDSDYNEQEKDGLMWSKRYAVIFKK